MFFISFIEWSASYHLYQITVVALTTQMILLYPMVVKVFGNTIHVSCGLQVVLLEDIPALNGNIYTGDIIKTLALALGLLELYQHLILNQLLWLQPRHHSSGTPVHILNLLNQSSSVPVGIIFILNGGLNYATNSMNFFSGFVLFILDYPPGYILPNFYCLWLWWWVLFCLFYQPLARCTSLWRWSFLGVYCNQFWWWK